MNYAIIVKILGFIMSIEAAFMLPSFFYSAYTRDGATLGFLKTILILIILSLITNKISSKDTRITPKDGLLIVSISWIVASIFGALPLYFTNSLPTYIDCLFEIVSGFTTTGSSVINNIEEISKSIVLWRSTTHWIGGMGILVFTLSLLPKLGVGGFQIFKAESPGPIIGKIEPKMSDTAKRLYTIYMIITVLLFILLKIGGMTVFDSIIHTFGVVGTGGFSSKADSVGYYNNGFYIPVVMSIFMALCGTNFSMYYFLYKKKFRSILLDEEFRLFYGIILTSTILIAINLYVEGQGLMFESLKDSLFQVTSIVSTSGFASVDYDLWPTFSKFILIILSMFGSCAGSTAGGIKIIRVLIIYKLIKREIEKVIHPNSIIPVKLNGKAVSEEIVRGVSAFIGVYIMVFLFSTALVSLSGVSLITAMTSVITTLSNVGPGLEAVGPSLNFFFYAAPYKLLFCVLMLLGRLEFFTLIAIIAPRQINK